MRIFRITALILSLSVFTAPYVSFIGHAVLHLMASQHAHEDNETAEPHHHEHDEEHRLITLNSLPLAVIASSVKMQPVIGIVSEAALFFDAEDRSPSLVGIQSFLGKDPPPRLEPFISLLLHPTNAPPLR